MLTAKLSKKFFGFWDKKIILQLIAVEHLG
jgi:hypothetical protein